MAFRNWNQECVANGIGKKKNQTETMTHISGIPIDDKKQQCKVCVYPVMMT